MHVTKSELAEIFRHFDRNKSGFINLDELLIGLQGDLDSRRLQFVRMAFNILDRDGSGIVTLDEIAAAYDESKNPDVLSGRKTQEEAFREFMNVWDQNQDGFITWQEFQEYYKGVSASIDSDDYFELMIRNAWRISGGEGMSANTANRRVLVTGGDGSQSINTVDRELGLRAGDKQGVQTRLMEQGINAKEISLYGGVDTASKTRSQVF
jgi:Ca2+-binding EF-hand superfamily protein